MKLYFITRNDFKVKEVDYFLKDTAIEIHRIDLTIQEILDVQLEKVVRDKTLQAYNAIQNPCVVEHGGLCIDALNGLPEGLSKPVWDTVDDRLCQFLRDDDHRTAIAKTVGGYCDGKSIQLFVGKTRGSLAESARGEYKFQWDPVFIPEGSKQTYAEMGFPAKAQYSQSRKAWEALVQAVGHSEERARE